MFAKVLVSSLVLGSVYGLIALGYSLIYKASALMSFTQGDMLTLGAFLGYTFYGKMKMPFILAFILTLILVFMFGLLLERSVINTLVKKNVLPIYTVLATIAVSYLIQNGSMLAWGTDQKPFPAIFSMKSIMIGSLEVQPEQIFCIVLSLVSMFLLQVFMKQSKVGSGMRAAAMDGMAATACGINVSWSKGLTWGLSAGMAALAGMAIGPTYGVYTTLGALIGRKGFSSAVMGGFGNMIGAIVGGLLLGILETFTAAYVTSQYKDLVAYVLLILFLFVKPTGIFNERAITE